MFSLQSVAAPLDIQRLSVQSVRGEPLKAVAVIRTESSELIAPECLSLGSEADLPFPDYPLLRNARIELSPAGDAVEISTVEPVTSPGVAVVLRVQCPGQALTARHFNLLIRQPWDRVPAQPADAAREFGRGTRLTIMHDETVASIARSLYPADATARRRLEQAIVAANPGLFPLGKAVALKAGTRLIVPDLRDAKHLAAAPQRPSPAPVSAPPPPTGPAPADGEAAAAGVATGAPLAKLPRKLRLKLARAELDLGRSEGIDEERRQELRRLYRGEVVTVAAAGTEALELKITQLRESQSAINSQLARLEQAIESLRRSITAMVSPAPPKPQPPRPVPEPVAVTPETPWMLWAAAAAGSLLFAALAFVLGRRSRPGIPVDEHEARIDALLKEAREAAGPLFEPERPAPLARPPVLPESITAAEPPRPAPPVAPAQPDTAMPETVSPLPELPDFLLENQAKVATEVDLELDAEPRTGPGETAEPSAPRPELKREMDVALDNSRSMFTDVDRFISLGRTQNAISLLEFQIHKNPNDRDSWVKLMAVYRQEGMETEFQRTFAEFKRKFPGEV